MLPFLEESLIEFATKAHIVKECCSRFLAFILVCTLEICLYIQDLCISVTCKYLLSMSPRITDTKINSNKRNIAPFLLDLTVEKGLHFYTSDTYDKSY